MKKKNIKLDLSDAERANLRKHKIKISEIENFATDELEEVMKISSERAREIHALIDFQQIPSIGIQFAKDLVFLGYYSISDLDNLDGAILTDMYEKKKGFRIDSCVEDQFRLATYFSRTHDYSKKWWDFTQERKKYRLENGYPADRPTINWHETSFNKNTP